MLSILVTFSLFSLSQGFIIPVRQSQRLNAASLLARDAFSRDRSAPGDDSRFDVEAARRRLEEMMGNDPRHREGTATLQALGFADSAPPPLTSIGRVQRMAEIRMLASLGVNDKTQEDLWTLWHNERGPTAAEKLREASELITADEWKRAEQKLLALIREHGIHWAEPVNLLATLYYMQGRMDESKELCELVLQVKPWHFGALSGIVMVCAAQNDISGASMWASKRLPPIHPNGNNRRRKEWVERAVENARLNLKGAEEGLRAFLKREDMASRNASVEDDDDDDGGGFIITDDAWQ